MRSPGLEDRSPDDARPVTGDGAGAPVDGGVTWLAPGGKAASEAGLEGAVRLLVEAFRADPFHGWLYPDPEVRAVALTHIFSMLLPRCVVACVGDPRDPDAVMALHHPERPAVGGGGALRAARSIPVPRRVFRTLRVAARLWMARPGGAQVVIELLAVHERARGRGLARQLLDPVLGWCDRAQVAAHLETTNPANLPLYERFGFEVRKVIDCGTPPAWVMRRPN